nr:MAG TPA_asm: hypothetical protein [Caudoviricetes sp.]
MCYFTHSPIFTHFQLLRTRLFCAHSRSPFLIFIHFHQQVIFSPFQLLSGHKPRLIYPKEKSAYFRSFSCRGF